MSDLTLDEKNELCPPKLNDPFDMTRGNIRQKNVSYRALFVLSLARGHFRWTQFLSPESIESQNNDNRRPRYYLMPWFKTTPPQRSEIERVVFFITELCSCAAVVLSCFSKSPASEERRAPTKQRSCATTWLEIFADSPSSPPIRTPHYISHQ